MTEPLSKYPVLTEDELKARKKRNLILAWSIVAFMALILAVTLVKLKEGVARKQDWAAETGKKAPVSDPVEDAGKLPSEQGADR